MEALKTPAFYGRARSRRNNAARRERLREFDLNEAELARLHGPAGIYIGSRTPPEIAISILAEITCREEQRIAADDPAGRGARRPRARSRRTAARLAASDH